MKRIKRLVALIGVVLFVCSAPTTAYAKADGFILSTGAEELIAVGGAVIGTETALGWALSMLGFTAAANTVYENRDEWMSWCSTQTERFHSWLDDRAEDLYCTTQQVDAWLKDVANGALDTTSECWDAFLDYCCWLEDAVTGSESESGSVENKDGFLVGANVGWSQSYRDFHGYTAYDVGWLTRQGFAAKWGVDLSDSLTGYYPDLFGELSSFVVSSEDWFAIYLDKSKRYGMGTYDYSINIAYANAKKELYSRYAFLLSESTGCFYRCYVENGAVKRGKISSMDVNLSFLQLGEKEFVSNVPAFRTEKSMLEYFETGTITDWNDVFKELLPQGYTFDKNFEMVVGNDLPQDVSVPRPGDTTEDVSDVVVAPDTSGIIDRDGSLDNVRVGDATGELVGVVGIPIDGIGLGEVATPYVGVPGVYPVDTVTSEIVGTDTPIDDVTPGIVPSVNGEYTIKGLENVFPFCVPYDLVALYDCMKAEPEAPKIKIPFPVGFQKGTLKVKTQEIEIDLSEFDTVAKVLRAMELLGFCVGLVLITRKLIRG